MNTGINNISTLDCYFMRKDTVLAKIKVSADNRVKIVQLYRPIPFIDSDYVEEWVWGRISPIFGRKNLEYILKVMGIRSLIAYINISYAISLTDCYWVKPINDSKTWKDINPYTHRISRVLSKLTLGFGQSGVINKSPSAEFRSDGSFDKCWIRSNGVLYLVKASAPKYNEMTGNESYSEVLVGQLAKALGITRYVDYVCENRAVGNNTVVICKCRNFTSENISFAPLESLSRLRYSDIETQYKFMCGCGDGILFLQMLLLDALTFNEDRHTGNYGIIYSPDNPSKYKMAPIFDNNLALFPRVQIRGRDKDEIIRDISFKRPSGDHFELFVEQGRWVIQKYPQFRDTLRKLYGFKFQRVNGLENLSDERLKVMNYMVNLQIRRILGC